MTMIPMSELVKDPTYRKFLETPPKMPAILRNEKMMSSPPWVVYVQREPNGPWGKKEVWKYSEAFHFLRKAMRAGVYDATINCKRFGFDPPSRMVRVKGRYVMGSDGVSRQATKSVPWKVTLRDGDSDHHWCRYCRRPTVFGYFSKHKALKLDSIDSTIPRCCICGASVRIAVGADSGFKVH